MTALTELCIPFRSEFFTHSIALSPVGLDAGLWIRFPEVEKDKSSAHWGSNVLVSTRSDCRHGKGDALIVDNGNNIYTGCSGYLSA